MKLIVAISGASGVEYAVDLLKALKEAKAEIHLVVSEWAEKLIEEETNYNVKEVKKLAGFVYENKDMSASICSSSFLVDGMIVIPASVKTVSEIATAHCGNLISRAADSMLRTRKKLIVCVRETPLSAPTLKNLYRISLYGGIIFPLSPAFYHKPKNLKGIRNFITGKTLDLIGIPNKKFKRWA
ncbi:MAG: UbiX family flavin prenyltransferase [Candidatus Diapherotrites archaeon]